MASEASRKRNLEEARALIANGVPFEKLESKHQTALNRVKANNRRKTVAEVQARNPDVSEADETRLALASSGISKVNSMGDLSLERATAKATASRRIQESDTNETSINADDSHRAQLGTIADHISNIVDQVEARGQGDTRQYALAVGHLASAYEAHVAHGDAHLSGYVDEAKQQITEMASHLTSAVENLRSKNPDLFSSNFGVNNRSLPKIINSIKEDYVNSTTPGVGAALAPGKVARQRPTVVPVDKTNYSVSERAAMGKPISGFTDDELAREYARMGVRVGGKKSRRVDESELSRQDETIPLENENKAMPTLISNKSARALARESTAGLSDDYSVDTPRRDSGEAAESDSFALTHVKNMFGYATEEEPRDEAAPLNIYDKSIYSKDELKNIRVHAVGLYKKRLESQPGFTGFKPGELESLVQQHQSWSDPLGYLKSEEVKPITSGLTKASRADKLNSSFRGE